ncbi:uncharacterized protein LOC110244470 [Exaiptasia diaphana]|uniref:Uncharacterized protein n=1 Tax=Exaiptasia diaphana TaxID=2652724 RepID=A0A913XLR6_EXADI|nr:uncharacterized protein LOC110244470 [Exaiptasia diaphana]
MSQNDNNLDGILHLIQISVQGMAQDPVLCKTQPGLFFAKPNFGVFVNIRYKADIEIDDDNVRDGIVGTAADVVNYAQKLDRKTEGGTVYRTRAIVAFNPNQWSKWFKNDAKLKGLDHREGDLLVNASAKFIDTGGDVYFVLKSDVEADLENALGYLRDRMSKYSGPFDITYSKTSDKRVIHNMFTEGLINPGDPESLKTYIVKNEGSTVGYPGSTYLVTQKFKFNWTILGNMRTVSAEVFYYHHHNSSRQ